MIVENKDVLVKVVKLIEKFVKHKIGVSKFQACYMQLWIKIRDEKISLPYAFHILIDSLFTDLDMFSVDPNVFTKELVTEDGIRQKSKEVLHYLISLEPALKRHINNADSIKLEKYDMRSLKKRLSTNAVFVKLIQKQGNIICFTWKIDKERKKHLLLIEEFPLSFVLKDKVPLPEFKKQEFSVIEEVIAYLDMKGYLKRNEWIKNET